MNHFHSFIPSVIQHLKPYLPGKQPRENHQVIKLNTNENPYPLPLEKELKEILNLENLSRYPDPFKTELTECLSYNLHLPPDCFAFGNGSDDLISAIFRTFLLFSSNRKVILTEYTYGAYRCYAEQNQVAIEVLPMSESFEIPLGRLKQFDGKVFFLSNPNSPTGFLIDAATIQQTCQENTTKLIIVDEAYIEFSRQPEGCIRLIEKNFNLIVLRTFSKSFSACGMRLGYALGNPNLIEAIKKMLDPYNVNLVAQKIGQMIFQKKDLIQENNQKIIRTRKTTTDHLEKLGFTVLPSQSNFLMVTLGKICQQESLGSTTQALFQYLEQNSILVRYFDQSILNRYLRISIGTDRQMEIVIQKIKSFLENHFSEKPV